MRQSPPLFVRSRQPQGLVPVNRLNRYGARARLLYYAHNGQAWDAINGQLLPDLTGNATYGVTNMHGLQAITNSVNANLYYQQAACPADLIATNAQTLLLYTRGTAANWSSSPGMALYDASSGSSTALDVLYSTATSIQIGVENFGGGGVSATVNVRDSLEPHVYAAVYLGDGSSWRLFVDGLFAGTQTRTADAAQSGTDTQVRFGRANVGTMQTILAGWFAGALRDAEVFELSQNVWQLFAPMKYGQFLNAGAASVGRNGTASITCDNPTYVQSGGVLITGSLS